jgi:cell wall assembly regulator SMI1
MGQPNDDLFQACCNQDVAAVRQLLQTHSFAESDLERMIPSVSGSAELLRIFLARCTPSAESMFQLVHAGATGNADVFEQILELKPTPEEIGIMLDSCQSSFTTRSVTYDEAGRQTIEILALSDSLKKRLARVFERGLDAGGKPQNVTTLVGGMVEIGRPDLAVRLARALPDLSDVAFFGFRDRSIAVQSFVREHADMTGAALCGAVSDDNEVLVAELLASGVRATGYQGPEQSTTIHPLECLGAHATARGAEALIDAGAQITAQSIVNAASSRNGAVLHVLLRAGGTDLEGHALVAATVSSQAQIIFQLGAACKYSAEILARALRIARETKHAETLSAVESAFVANSLEVPPVPPPWQASINLATAALPELWSEWLRYRRDRVYAHETARPLSTEAELRTELGALQADLNIELPEDLVWLYQNSNGEDEAVPYGRGMMFGERLLSLREAHNAVLYWQGVRASIADTPNEQEGTVATPAFTVKCEYINARWIPLSDVGQNHIAVDLDPGPNGVPGQIIQCGRDSQNKVQYGVSLTEFVRSMLRQIVADNVEVLEDSGFNLGKARAGMESAARELIFKGW